MSTTPRAADVNPDATATYLAPLDRDSRDLLVGALQLAADRMENDLHCGDCIRGTCADDGHADRTRLVRGWRSLAADIARLPATAGPDTPLIAFDADACDTWLRAGAATAAGIHDGFSSNNLAIAAGLEELLHLLHDDPSQQAWRTNPHVHQISIWRTADSDGVDGGGVVTADLTYMGERVRLASLHQGCDEFTDDPATSGIDAAVQALGHVAAIVNREYVNFRRATGCPPPAGNDADTYTVVGIWSEDEPVPVGVIAGEHEVSGGDDGDYFPQGVWATSVTAADDLAAEQAAIAEMRDSLA